jgi:hypothetical protein
LNKSHQPLHKRGARGDDAARKTIDFFCKWRRSNSTSDFSLAQSLEFTSLVRHDFELACKTELLAALLIQLEKQERISEKIS